LASPADGLDERARRGLTLAGVIAVGAILRVVYLDYGLPEVGYVDAFRFVDEARGLADAEEGWRPFDYVYPGLLKLLLATLYSLLDIDGRYGMHLTARVIAALADVGTLALLTALALRMRGVAAALLAAGLYAVCVVAVTSSRVEASDTLLTFFLLAAFTLATSERHDRRALVFAGALVGAAAGTKFTGALGGLALLAGAWLQLSAGVERKRVATGLLGGALAAAVVFLASTPWFFQAWDEYVGGARMIMQAQTGGMVGQTQAHALSPLLSTTVASGQPWLTQGLLGNTGPLVVLLVVAGLAAGWSGRLGARARVFAVFATALYLVAAGEGRLIAARFLLPLLPFAFLLGALLVDRLRRRSLVALATVALVAWPLVRTLDYVARGAKPLTNEDLRAWSRAEVPKGARVFVSPFYTDDLEALDVQLGRLNNPGGRLYGATAEAQPLYVAAVVDELAASGVQYVVLNSSFEGSFRDTPDNQRFFPRNVDGYRAFRARLDELGELAFEVKGHSEGRLGPDITVYRLRAR
jgi:hypothetical protein